jgi:hypothetical protein
VQDLIENKGLTPQQATMMVMQSNPTRFNPQQARNFDDYMKQSQMQFSQQMQMQDFQMQQQLQPFKIQQLQQDIEQTDFNNRAERQKVYGEIIQEAGGGKQGIYSATQIIPDGEKGGQCGAFVNDLFSKAGSTAKV